MAEKIKGISGSIPSLTLFMDHGAGKRDGKIRDLFKKAMEHPDDIKESTRAYSEVPWIGTKIGHYSGYCDDLYQEAAGKLSPISENIAKEIRQHKNYCKLLENSSEENEVLIEALKDSIRTLEENMSDEREQIENIDVALRLRISGLGETLNVHVRKYLQGVKRSVRGSSLPGFDALELEKTSAQNAYDSQRKRTLEKLKDIL